MAIAASRALPVSPMLDLLHSGGFPASEAPSSHSDPTRAAIVWSVPGQIRPGSLLVSTRVAVDESGVADTERFVVDAQAGRRPWSPVRRDDIGRCNEALERSPSAGRLEVEPNAALTAVGAETHVRTVPVGVVHRVDLDHVGAEVSEHPTGERPGNTQAEIEHSHPL